MFLLRTEVTAALLFAIPTVLTQTFTDCDPTKKTCPSNAGLSSTTFDKDFTQTHAQWTAAAGTDLQYTAQGAEFTITKDGQAPTLASDFYIFFGKVEVVMQAATGIGIVSSIVLESDDLDEIDWEFLGGDTAQCQTNFYGKGNTTTYDRALYIPVTSPQTTFHTYTVDWTSERIQWSIDGAVIRTLLYTDHSTNAGHNYPQTPMRVKLGNWAGGGSNQPAGTVQWAGGATDFSKSPFTMYVKSVSITNYNPASSYTYSDMSGSYGSITFDKSNSSTSASSSASSSSPAVSSAAAATSGPSYSFSVSLPASSDAPWPTSSDANCTTHPSSTRSHSSKRTSHPGTKPVHYHPTGSGYATRSAPGTLPGVTAWPIASNSIPAWQTSSTTSTTSSTPAHYTGAASALGPSLSGSMLSLALFFCMF